MSAQLEALVGTEVDRVEIPIDRSKVREFARALGDESPVYSELEAARDAGFPAIPVPLTATAMAMHWRPRSEVELIEKLGLDLARVLHGESEWEYLGEVYVGDELRGTRSIASVKTIEGKRGGEMRLVVLESEYRNQRDELVIRQRDTLIETAGRSA